MRVRAFAFWVVVILSYGASRAQGGQASPDSSAADLSLPAKIEFADHDIKLFLTDEERDI